MRNNAGVKLAQLITNIYGFTRNASSGITQTTLAVLIRSADNGIGHLIYSFGLSIKRREQDVGKNGNVERHTEGLGPEVININHKRDIKLLSGFTNFPGNIIGWNLAVNQIVVVMLIEILRHPLGNDVMRPDTLGAHILGVKRLLNKSNCIGVGPGIKMFNVALTFFPMLKSRSNKIDIIAMFMQQRCKIHIACCALDLIAKLGILRIDGNSLLVCHINNPLSQLR